MISTGRGALLEAVSHVRGEDMVGIIGIEFQICGVPCTRGRPLWTRFVSHDDGFPFQQPSPRVARFIRSLRAYRFGRTSPYHGDGNIAAGAMAPPLWKRGILIYGRKYALMGNKL